LGEKYFCEITCHPRRTAISRTSTGILELFMSRAVYTQTILPFKECWGCLPSRGWARANVYLIHRPWDLARCLGTRMYVYTTEDADNTRCSSAREKTGRG